MVRYYDTRVLNERKGMAEEILPVAKTGEAAGEPSITALIGDGVTAMELGCRGDAETAFRRVLAREPVSYTHLTLPTTPYV